VDISCAFATSSDSPAHVAIAEELGYQRAWLYDSPAVYPDVWMVLSRCAERTSRIGLGPGVLVPSLRHPMVNAAAIAELVGQAPGRVAVAIGSGFSGRLALGKRPMLWRQVADYVRCLKALLAGETGMWDGATIRMLQLPGFGAKRPIDVPILIGADGPKGLAVAAELGDGVFSAALASFTIDVSATLRHAITVMQGAARRRSLPRRQRAFFGPCGLEVRVAQSIPYHRDRRLVIDVIDCEPDLGDAVAG
jgi:5,10-methylenetetrahydromethanopterin reductase